MEFMLWQISFLIYNIINVLYGYFYTAWKESAAKILKQENKDAYYNSIYHDIKRFLFAVTSYIYK